METIKIPVQQWITYLFGTVGGVIGRGKKGRSVLQNQSVKAFWSGFARRSFCQFVFGQKGLSIRNRVLGFALWCILLVNIWGIIGLQLFLWPVTNW